MQQQPDAETYLRRKSLKRHGFFTLHFARSKDSALRDSIQKRSCR